MERTLYIRAVACIFEMHKSLSQKPSRVKEQDIFYFNDSEIFVARDSTLNITQGIYSDNIVKIGTCTKRLRH